VNPQRRGRLQHTTPTSFEDIGGMLTLPFPDKRVMQMCWVVPDLHAAMNDWVQKTGIGPFFYFDKVQFEDGRYRGVPAQMVEHAAAIGQAGDMQIELVCQTVDQPSIWREVVPKGQSGLHHIALYCEDYQGTRDAYTATGAEVAYEGLMMGHRTCWLDTTATFGFMIELVTKNPVAEAVFGQIRDASINWDGKDPIRTLS
jgi:hypothetical protein